MPSLTSTPSALEHVCLAWPYSWLSVVIDGVAVPGGYFPAMIAFRRTAASCMYALGSDSSPIDILEPYSIGKVANRNASTVVDPRRVQSYVVVFVACTCGIWSVMTHQRGRCAPGSATTWRRSCE